MALSSLLSRVSPERLERHVRALEGLRHGQANPKELEEKARMLESALADLGLTVESQPVSFPHGHGSRNLIATHSGQERDREWIVVGAHFDGVWETPGADDNASGVAVLLEAARLLSQQTWRRALQFVAFTLEEPQTLAHRFLVGSRQFVKEARRQGRRYAGAMILECVGYTDDRQRSQDRPWLVRIPAPDAGNFLAVVANRRSARLMKTFQQTAARLVPGLSVVGYRTPLGGYLIPPTRFSDHASFWDAGYPAVMLTDTAMFRNPHYHQPTDRADTLDYAFMAAVARATIATVATLAEW